jgi:hypothetical protein
VAGGEYLQALGARLIAGRWFREDDMRESNNGAIVGELTAKRLWPAESALGKEICVDCTPETTNNWKRVVGVVSGIRHTDLDSAEPNSVVFAGRGPRARGVSCGQDRSAHGRCGAGGSAGDCGGGSGPAGAAERVA